jgi:T3SS negative regulator,GrlR
MLEGLWTIEFVSNAVTYGAGVVVLEYRRIKGSDSSYYYLGKFSVEDKVVKAEIEVTHYIGPPHSIFALSHRFKLKLSGNPETPVMELKAHFVDNLLVEDLAGIKAHHFGERDFLVKSVYNCN